MSEEQNIEQSTDDRPQSTENISEPSTTNQKLQTEMEVHKHPHHVTHKKKWTEYLLEFFMLFLAVFLGFVAENFREHNEEKNREREFARSIYKEFYNDSIVAATKISLRLEKINSLGYMSKYIKDSNLNSLPKNFYPAFAEGLYVFNIFAFEPKDGVLNQLINSGSLRYFKNMELQKLFGDITVCINNIRFRNQQEYQFFSDPLKPFCIKHFDFNWLDSVRNGNYEKNILDVIHNYQESGTTVKAEILNLDSFDRKEAINIILFWKQLIISTQTLQLKEYIATNHKILEELRHNYTLTNE